VPKCWKMAVDCGGMLSGAVASLPFISLGFFEGEDLRELPDQGQVLETLDFEGQ